MKYVKWFFFAIIDLLFNVVAYITNPIVLLFADEVGNLPKIFLWWANWDDHLDVDWMVYEHHVPKWAEYDFNKHYKYYDEWEAEKTIGEHRGYVELLDPHFTLKERFQRYVCRLAWMYRNCAYGFSYYVTGMDVYGKDVRKVIDTKEIFFYETDYSWVYSNSSKSFIKGHRWKIFLGWKMQATAEKEKEHCMLAFCINPWK